MLVTQVPFLGIHFNYPPGNTLIDNHIPNRKREMEVMASCSCGSVKYTCITGENGTVKQKCQQSNKQYLSNGKSNTGGTFSHTFKEVQS